MQALGHLLILAPIAASIPLYFSPLYYCFFRPIVGSLLSTVEALPGR